MTIDWRKANDFSNYVKAQRLLDYTPPWARDSHAAKHIRRSHQKVIDRLEADYPDFKEEYESIEASRKQKCSR